jgi:hypothetical protein
MLSDMKLPNEDVYIRQNLEGKVSGLVGQIVGAQSDIDSRLAEIEALRAKKLALETQLELARSQYWELDRRIKVRRVRGKDETSETEHAEKQVPGT